MIPENFLNFLKRYRLDPEDQARLDDIFEDLMRQYPEGKDPWGLNLKKVRPFASSLLALYKKYFRVRVFGVENIPEASYVATSNHSGQIAIDGMLVSLAFLTEGENPKLLRALVERFFVSLPFLAPWAQYGGAVLGDRDNCLRLLDRGESVLVFPEGVRGVSKSTNDFYQLQSFGRGFYRMAMKAQKNILPIAVVGAEEFYPLVYQWKKMANFLSLPALPITPTFPLLGPLGLIPLPSPIDIYIGPVIETAPLTDEASEKTQVEVAVADIERKIQKMINEGLKKRRSFFAKMK